MSEEVIIHCMVTIFPILPARKWSILVTICISKNKIMFFLHIAPRQALSICHAWRYSRKLRFSTTTCLVVIKSKSKAPFNYLKAHTITHYTAFVLFTYWYFAPSLSSSCAAFGVRRAWRDWSRYGTQVGMYLSTKCTFLCILVRVICGVARRWCQAENFILLP